MRVESGDAPRPDDTLYSIQALRALAAWIVVGHHVVQIFQKSLPASALKHVLQTWGSVGVDVFLSSAGWSWD